MTQADRLCIKVALWPTGIYVVGLLGFMLVRTTNGLGPLPDGTGVFVPMLTTLVTLGAIVTASLLRIRLARVRG